MIPEREPGEPGEELPLTAGFAVVLALGAAYLQFAIFVVPVIFDWAHPAALQSPARLGIAAILAYGGAFALATRRIHDAPGQVLGFVRSPRQGWMAALLLLPSIVLISEIDNIFKLLLPVVAAADTPAVEGLYLVEWAVFLIAVLPVVEEVFFRGLLQPPLVQAWGRTRGVLACAAIAGIAFSVGLLNYAMFPIVAARGLLLGMLRESAGSLLPGLVLNVTFGAVAVLAMRSFFGIPGFDDSSSAHTPLLWLAPAAISTGAAIGLCRALLRAREQIARAESADGDA
ncbi:MAG: CPBP family intramembrane metalloprotease [Deltaproteobacteria bacterium]|nr:CPBP family intramembrane metalloprotease [Deltaproteobacteria bacterium]